MRPRPIFDEMKYGQDAASKLHSLNEFRNELILWFYEVLANPHVQAVLHIPDDEPIFVLRAQDKFSIRVINEWLLLAGPGADGDVNNVKFLKAMKDYRQFKEWQKNNPDKVKIPD